MSIFSRFRQAGALRKLRKTAKKNPSPTTIGALAERYIACGRLEDASRIAEAGLACFPASERLQAVSTFAKKQRLQSQITRLRREMKEHPTPSAYSSLAEIHRELGNNEEALKICQQCIERFPLNEKPYLIVGEVRLTRFIADRIARDGQEAERQLSRVTKLNSQNLKAHLLLGQLYYLIGALEPMRDHMEAALALSPASKEFEKFLRQADAGAFESGAEDLEEDDFLDDEEGLTVEELIRSIESNRRFRNRPDGFPKNSLIRTLGATEQAFLDVEGLRRSLSRIGVGEGVTNAIIIDRDGEHLADLSDPDALTRKQFSELISEVVRTAEDASRRMDVGKFQWCTVEGSFGGITVNRVKSISVGLKYDVTLRPERAQEMVSDFASRNLTAEREVTGA